MVFNFPHLKVDYKNGKKWELMPFDFKAPKRTFLYMARLKWKREMDGMHYSGVISTSQGHYQDSEMIPLIE